MVKMSIKGLLNVARDVFVWKQALSDCSDCSAERYLAEGSGQVAVDEAKRLGVDVVGFSGGVAYSEHLTHAIRRFVEENRLRFVVHKSIPAGDGGTSFGQTIAAG